MAIFKLCCDVKWLILDLHQHEKNWAIKYCRSVWEFKIKWKDWKLTKLKSLESSSIFKGGSARFCKYQEFSHFDVSEKCCRWSPQAWFRYVRFNWVWNKTLLHKWSSQTPHYIFWWMLNVAQSTILEEGSILNSASIQTWSISNILQEIDSSSKDINLSQIHHQLFFWLLGGSKWVWNSTEPVSRWIRFGVIVFYFVWVNKVFG